MRYGYRRVHVLLQRDGWAVNAKRVYRLYQELGLQLRNKTPKRRVKAKLREDRTDARQINETWAMDFVHDQLATGRKIRVLTIVDTFSRFSPAVDPRFSYRGEDVVLTLERICKRRLSQDDPRRPGIGVHLPRSRSVGLPEGCRARLLPARQADRQQLHRIVQRQVPSECLNAHWFLSLDDARQKMEDWRRDYNRVYYIYLTMCLKRRGFAGQDAILRGILDLPGPFRDGLCCGCRQRRPLEDPGSVGQRVDTFDLAGLGRQSERLGGNLQEFGSVAEVEPWAVTTSSPRRAFSYLADSER